MGAKVTSVSVKTWMAGSFAIETTMTVMMWSAMPLPFQLWSVFCLAVDFFIMTREWILHPLLERMNARKTTGMLPV